MKEKSIISASTLVVSLITYWYAKTADKDAAPYMLLGGFIGSLIGETIVESISKDKISNNKN
jgi:uncharacterized membrane protein YfcA